MDVKEWGLSVDLIHLTQGGDKWPNLVNEVMNLRVP
jgi:hypothetical protein